MIVDGLDLIFPVVVQADFSNIAISRKQAKFLRLCKVHAAASCILLI